MSFLTIPSQKGLFTAIKTGKSADEADCKSPVEDDEDDDDTEDVHLIPRCSPIPRKRGQSIFDETAEYMRIHSALPAARRRVSFADTTGGDLVDVKEFIAFDSDEEEDSERWEQEEARYRKPEREPTYQVNPEFHAPAGSALTQAVHANKVEVELLSPVENEPLAFSGIIRVLNVSYHKAVYVRSTMDSWASYFDYPADYVQGSHDGHTDKFSFKLSFAPPYITHGSRIEFVVRYETSDGDYWANNSGMNYVVTLLLSYEDDSPQTSNDMQEIRGILKPPKMYSMDDDYGYDDESDRDGEDPGPSKPQPIRPTPVCPIIVQPEIDLEIADYPSGSPVPPNQDLPSGDGTLSTATVSPGEQFPRMSSETALQTNDEDLSFILRAEEPIQPCESQPLNRLHCELSNQIPEQPKESSASTLLPASSPSSSYLLISCTSLATEGEEQEKGGSRHNEHEHVTVTNPPITELQHSIHSDSNIAKQSLFPATLELEQVSVEEKGDLKQEIEDTIKEEGLSLAIMTQEPPDYTTDPTEVFSGSHLYENKTKSSSQRETSSVCPASFEKKIDDTKSDPGAPKNEEGAFQTDSKVTLSISQAFGEEDVTLDTFCLLNTNTLPTATVIPGEQSPYVSSETQSQTTDVQVLIASQCNRPLEATQPSLMEAATGSTKEYASLKKEECTNTDREKEQDFYSQEAKKPLTALSIPSEDRSDTGPQTEISLSSTEASEKWALMDDTDVASLKRGKEVLLTMTKLDVSQITEEDVPTKEDTDKEKDSIQVKEFSTHPIRPTEISSQIEAFSLSPTFPDESTTQKLLDDNTRCAERGIGDQLTETRPGFDSFQAVREEIPCSVASCMWLPTTETSLSPTGENGLTHSQASHTCPELPADCVSFPSVTFQHSRQGVRVGSSELAKGLSEDSSSSALHDENSTSALMPPVIESQVSLGADGEAAPSPAHTGNASVITGVIEVNQNTALNSAQAGKEKEDSVQVSPDTLLEDLPKTLSEVANPLNPQSERVAGRNLRPSIVFLGVVVFLSVVFQEPNALFFMGLFVCLSLFYITPE